MQTFDRTGFCSDNLKFVHHRDVLKLMLFKPTGSDISDIASPRNDVVDDCRSCLAGKNDFLKELLVVVAAIFEFCHSRSIAVEGRLVVRH